MRRVFSFAPKVPKEITHVRRLRACEAVLDRFLDESVGLGDKRGVLLVQLPPSFHFEAPVASEFFRLLRGRFAGLVACEPRHGS